MDVRPLRGAPARVPPWVLAALLAALGLLEVLAVDDDLPGSAFVNAAFALLVAVPLVSRRSAPLATLTVIVGLEVVWVNAVFLDASQPPLQPFLCLLVAIYAAAARPDGAATLAVAALAGVAALGDVPALAEGRAVGNVVPAWLFYGLALALGATVGRGRRSVSALEAHAVRLEREREEQTRTATELERARIARELHDVITHGVSSMVLHASVERRLREESEDSTDAVLLQIEQIGRQSLDELRRLLGVLRERGGRTELAPQPSLTRVDALVEQVREAGLDAELEVVGEPTALPAGLDVTGYRIVQEALTNALKHAPRAHVDVLVEYRSDELRLRIADDGRGAVNGSQPGHGLTGIRERVLLYDGELEVHPRGALGGFELAVRLPRATAGR